MANKVYVHEETALSIKSSAGDATITLTSLAQSGTRVSTQIDRTANARSARYYWRFRTKLGATTTSVVVGNAISLYLVTADTSMGTSKMDGNLGTSDAAFTSIEKRRNLQFIGCVEVDKTAASGDEWIGSGIIEISARYIQLGVVNECGNTLSATATDHEFTLTPMPDELQ